MIQEKRYKRILIVGTMALISIQCVTCVSISNMNQQLQGIVNTQQILIVEQLETMGIQRDVIRKMTEHNIPGKIYESVSRWTKVFNLDEDFMLALTKHESNYYQWKKGSHNEIGVMQIRLIAAQDIVSDITEDELWDIDTNIMIGCNYFKILLDKYGEYRLAAIAYNRGQGIVDAALASGIDPGNGYFSRVRTIADNVQ